MAEEWDQRIQLRDTLFCVRFLKAKRGDKNPAVVHIRHETPDGNSVEFDILRSEIAMIQRILQTWIG